jgi:starch phosphorylase
LIFKDISRLRKINDIGPIQLIFAGKAHPQDEQGKEMIKAVIQAQQALSPEIKAVYLENYDIAMAKLIISGVDLWLNTPQKPQEASGTSGMKAACNGIPSLSILDGWWLEGALEDKTGWIIESKNIENQDLEESNILDANNLYDKLENKIIPIFYNNRQQWLDIMRQSIYLNASLFNCQRLMQEYFEKAYQKVV